MLTFGTTMNCSRTKPAPSDEPNTTIQQFPGFALRLVNGERDEAGMNYQQGKVTVTSRRDPLVIVKLKWRSAKQSATLENIAQTYATSLSATAKYNFATRRSAYRRNCSQ